MNEPIVLIGGFGSHWTDYRPAARRLANVSQRRVFIAGINRLTWALGGLSNYSVLVDRAHAAINHALQVTGAQKVIVVGHSAGGVIGRAYLGDKTAKAYLNAYHGYDRVSRLYMIGSPLVAVGDVPRRAMHAASWVDQTYPGAFFASKGVQYMVVRGKYIEGKLNGDSRQREAYFNYRFISDWGSQWGDGVVPLSLNQLEGAVTLELEGVAHSPGWPRWFFSDEETIRSWWSYFDLGDAPTLERKEMLV